MNSTSPVPLRQPLVRGQPSALSHPPRFPRLLPSFLSARRLLPSFVRLVVVQRRGRRSFSLPLFSLPARPISRTGRSSSRSRIQRVAPELLLARFTFQAFDEPFRLFASRPKELSNAHETRRRAIGDVVFGVPSDVVHLSLELETTNEWHEKSFSSLLLLLATTTMIPPPPLLKKKVSRRLDRKRPSSSRCRHRNNAEEEEEEQKERFYSWFAQKVVWRLINTSLCEREKTKETTTTEKKLEFFFFTQCP